MQYNNNYLSHRRHKYLKKEFKNGKWRYYYDLPGMLGQDKKTEMSMRKYEYLKTTGAKNIKDADRRTTASYVNMNSAKNLYNDGRKTNSGFQDKYQKNYNKKQMTWAEYTDAQKAYEKAKNDYNRTPMGITENAVNKGKAFVDKLFNKK